MMRWRLGTLVILLAVPLSPADGPPAVADLENEPLQLLGDCIRIRMPSGSRIEGRSTDIMAPQPADERETRVIYDAGERRYVLMAYQTFCQADADSDRRIREMGAEIGKAWGDSTTEPLPGGTGYRTLVTRVTPKDLTSDAILMGQAWFINTDQTIQVIQAYVNPEAAKDLDAAQNLLMETFKTLRPGSRHLNLAARTVFLPMASSSWMLCIRIPSGHAMTSETGPDFSVYRVEKIVSLGEDSPSIGIYLGDHPRLFYDKRRPSQVKTMRSKLLGKRVKWHDFASGQGEMREALRSVSKVSRNFKLHVFCSAPDGQALTETETIVNSLCLVKAGDITLDESQANTREAQ